VTADPQATLVVEYPCELFCRIELELAGERGDLTLRQLREKAEDAHRRIHEPGSGEPEAPAANQAAPQRPAATLFRSAPAAGDDRRREPRVRPRR
jgi:hypothetical protein